MYKEKKYLSKVKISELKPYANNPRKNENSTKAVENSIKQFGYIAPIVVDEDMELITGHTRLRALKDLGKDFVDIIQLTGMSEEEKKAYRIADNSTGDLSTWDFEKLDIEMQDLHFDMKEYGLFVNSFDIEKIPDIEITGETKEVTDYVVLYFEDIDDANDFRNYTGMKQDNRRLAYNKLLTLFKKI